MRFGPSTRTKTVRTSTIAVRAPVDATPRPKERSFDGSFERFFDTAGTALELALEVEAMREASEGTLPPLGLIEVGGRVFRDAGRLARERGRDRRGDTADGEEHAEHDDQDREAAAHAPALKPGDGCAQHDGEEDRDDDVEHDVAEVEEQPEEGEAGDGQPDRREVALPRDGAHVQTVARPGPHSTYPALSVLPTDGMALQPPGPRPTQM